MLSEPKHLPFLLNQMLMKAPGDESWCLVLLWVSLPLWTDPCLFVMARKNKKKTQKKKKTLAAVVMEPPRDRLSWFGSSNRRRASHCVYTSSLWAHHEESQGWASTAVQTILSVYVCG